MRKGYRHLINGVRRGENTKEKLADAFLRKKGSKKNQMMHDANQTEEAGQKITYAIGPSFFHIFAKQSIVFLYFDASNPCNRK
jgi:hypothetical protein